ncbi:hypothetical protein CG747_13400 [Streptomyces sp. CB02959]|nr:hypothetical protein CG747_13400 [Streptomyces sp. CB02959]
MTSLSRGSTRPSGETRIGCRSRNPRARSRSAKSPHPAAGPSSAGVPPSPTQQLVKALFFLALMRPTDPARTDKRLKWRYRRHLFQESSASRLR